MSLLDLTHEQSEEFDYKKYIVSNAAINKKLKQYVNGSIPRGYKSGFNVLDSVIVCKINEMLACTGKKGRGKTTIQQILFLIWAIANDLTFVLALQENENSLSKMDLLGYLLGNVPNNILKTDEKLYNKAVNWLDEHFIFLNVESFYEATEVVKCLVSNGKLVHGLFCDPVNSFSSGFSDTNNSYKDDKVTAKKMLDFSTKYCSVFLSQHPTMANQRSSEDVNSYSGEGGHFLNKAHFTWAINRDNGSSVNRISVDNIRVKYTGGGVTHPEHPLLLHWSPYNIDIEHNGHYEKDIIQALRKKHNPLKEMFTDDLPNWIEELPKVDPKDAFKDDENEKDFPF